MDITEILALRRPATKTERFLHAIGGKGFHFWSDWSNPVDQETGIAGIFSGPQVVQIRVCLVCNLVSAREVTINDGE